MKAVRIILLAGVLAMSTGCATWDRAKKAGPTIGRIAVKYLLWKGSQVD